MSKLNQGDISKDGHTRYCGVNGHKEHGILYCCEYYSEELKKQINRLADNFRNQCSSGEIKINLIKNGITKTKKYNELKDEDFEYFLDSDGDVYY